MLKQHAQISFARKVYGRPAVTVTVTMWDHNSIPTYRTMSGRNLGDGLRKAVRTIREFGPQIGIGRVSCSAGWCYGRKWLLGYVAGGRDGKELVEYVTENMYEER